MIPAEDATHILKFVLQKLNIWHQLDFHTALYLCSGAFQSMNIYSYLTDELEWSKWIWPSYIFGMVWLSQTGHSQITHRLMKTVEKLRLRSSKHSKRLSKTECKSGFEVCKTWHFAYNIIFGILAWSTVRMKYLWTPHLLLVSTCGLVLICEHTVVAVMTVLSRLMLARQIWSQKQYGDSQKQRKPNKFPSAAYRKRLNLDPFECILWRWRLAYILVLSLTVYFLIHTSYQLTERFKDLGEFYDPDTVELMQWIRNNTEPDAIFTGSMQLMAGVKLCTGRPIANHPHYESAQLRERTRQVIYV
ncbi:hypothetical protein PHET_09271 [Paragonimus heterotremus]|uniref:Uncharacterized protein n=1 Tax=Paragonimus heterotremus TaxID=100268 RepID=A0A8J4TB77_9TREM|nr:hypothetical protein PHET_09271 [Paragonimus heterotremus]